MIVPFLILAAALSLGRAESFSILAGAGVKASGPMRVTGNVGAGSGGVTGITPATGDILPGGDALKDVEKALDDIGSATDIVVFRLGDNPTFAKPPPGVPSSGIFWLVTGSATLPEQSTFVGTLIATGDITVREGVTVSGRLISRHGTVTLTTDDINLCCEPIALSELPNGIANLPYHATILPAGDTYSLFAGELPKGVGPLTTTGTLSGIPTTPGSYTFIVLAKDFKGCSSIRTYTIVICGPPVIGPAALPDAVAGSAYTVPITATGTHVFTTTQLPAGLTLTPASCTAAALLSGTPQTPGDYHFTITATDCDGACSGSRDYTLEVACPVITVFPPALDTATAGTPYQKVITASGSLEPYTFSAGPSTPPGVIVDPSGVLSFTPSTKGPYSVTVKATDSHGCSGTSTYTIAVDCPPITILPESLDPGTVNVDYDAQLTAGPLPGSYTFTAANPLSWLNLSHTGHLSGKPPAAGTYELSVIAFDNVSGCSGSRIYSIVVTAAPPCAITISPAALARGTVAVPYSKMIFITGGTPPYTVSPATAGPLTLTQSPNGVVTISGLPAAPGVLDFTVTAIDINGCIGDQKYSIAIDAPLVPGPVIPTLSEWMLLMLSILLACAGLFLIRKGGAA